MVCKRSKTMILKVKPMKAKPEKPHEVSPPNGILASYAAGFADGKSGAELAPPSWVRESVLHARAYRNGHEDGLVKRLKQEKDKDKRKECIDGIGHAFRLFSNFQQSEGVRDKLEMR